MEKIRILFAHHQLVCGGAEQALFDLICLLDKERFDISVWVHHDDGIWTERFRNEGISVTSIWDCQVPSNDPLIKLQNLKKRIGISRALKHDGQGLIEAIFPKGFDIVVSFHEYCMPKMFVSDTIKTVRYIHGDVATNEDYLVPLLNNRKDLMKFDRFICVSETARQSFMRMLGISVGVEAHFNPINSEYVLRLAQASVTMPYEKPVVCAVGRLSPEKGFGRLIRIHRDLTAKGIAHDLLIIGDGEEKENLLNTIRECDVQNSVHMIGYQANPYPYMKNSRFVVCSSYTEGLSVIAMEALALGIPVVSSVPSIKELFGEEICGIITENDDESLKNGIERMLVDEAFYTGAVESAKNRSKYFNGKRMVKEIENVFLDLYNQKD